MRTIKSFVMRGGRISKRQQFALEHWLKDYTIPLNDEPWSFEKIFSRQADTIVEIGFGMGASLQETAVKHPEINFIGIEVHQAGIGALTVALHDNGIKNVRIVPHDAVEIFKYHMPQNALSGVHVFFPDPWTKKRHHKRRLIQREFVNVLMTKIKRGGFIHCATDWQAYAEQMLSVFLAQPGLQNVNEQGGFSPRPATRPLTKFEQRGYQLGHGVWDLIFKKI